MTAWHSLIEIDRNWVLNQLNHLFQDIDVKININLYTVKVSGTTISPASIANELHYMLPDYVYGKKKRQEIGERKAALTANHFFGQKDPRTDGKYGELLLFALVEGVLGCKMIAHKIRSLTNFVDQVKGGDGLFIGNYTIADGRKVSSYLIGESKIVAQYNKALSESLESVNRFCDTIESARFTETELIVAKENLILDDAIDLDELYDRLDPTSQQFKNQNLVIPILLMFNSTELVNCEMSGCTTSIDLEKKIKDLFLSKKKKIVTSIQNKISEFKHVSKVHVHFFLIPFNDIDSFRHTMYYKIHGVPYK